jgi:hypothetical protein
LRRLRRARNDELRKQRTEEERAFGLLAPTKKPWAKRRPLVDDSTLPETAISEAEEKSAVMPRYAR